MIYGYHPASRPQILEDLETLAGGLQMPVCFQRVFGVPGFPAIRAGDLRSMRYNLVWPQPGAWTIFFWPVYYIPDFRYLCVKGHTAKHSPHKSVSMPVASFIRLICISLHASL